MQKELPDSMGMFRKDIAQIIERDRRRGLFIERNNRWRFDTHPDTKVYSHFSFRFFIVTGVLLGLAIAHKNRYQADSH